jgi:hypothetical protein
MTIKLTYETEEIRESGKIPDNFTGIVEHSNGSKDWLQNGKLHRLDGPAVEYWDGDERWLQNGKLHRLDGPAVEWKSGYKEYWINGKRFDSQKSWQKEVDKINGKKNIVVCFITAIINGKKSGLSPLKGNE